MPITTNAVIKSLPFRPFLIALQILLSMVPVLSQPVHSQPILSQPVLSQDDISTNTTLYKAINFERAIAFFSAGAQGCQDRPLGDRPYNYAITSDNVTYHSPGSRNGTGWVVRQSAVTFPDKIFSLPFNDRNVRFFSGWLYEHASWHYAIDYYVDHLNSTFEVNPAADGKVIFVGWDNWSGNTIVISHPAGGVADAYRTIYMHLRNGPVNDCNLSWQRSMTFLSRDPANAEKLRSHLIETGCIMQPGNRRLLPLHWGTPEQKINVRVGDAVTTGDTIGFAGDTGPGGQVAANDPLKPNLHLHIFFARRDLVDNQWYFFDPYGVYGARDCYPNGITERVNPAAARFSIAWKDNTPRRP